MVLWHRAIVEIDSIQDFEWPILKLFVFLAAKFACPFWGSHANDVNLAVASTASTVCDIHQILRNHF